MKNIAISILILTLSFFSLTANAQEDRISMEESKKEASYLDAFMPTLYGGDYLAASIEKFNRLLEEYPSNDAAHYTLAKLYIKDGNLTKALSFAQRAHRIDPENKWYSILIARIYETMNRYVEAAEVYKKLSEQYPENQIFATDYAFFLLRSGNAAKALEAINAAERRLGFSPDLSLKKIKILDALRKPEAVETEWESLIDYDPSNMDWQLNLAKHYLSMENEKKAVETLNHILMVDPANVRAQLTLSELDVNSESYSRDKLASIISDPSNSLDLKINTLIPLMDKLTPDSIETNKFLLNLAEKITSQYPQNAKSWALLGDFYFNAGHTGAAAEAFKKSCNLTKSVYSVWQQYLLCLQLTAQYDKLYKAADEALIYFPNRAMNYYFLALADGMKKNYDAALNNLSSAQLVAGGNHALLQKIAGLHTFILVHKEHNPSPINEAIKNFASTDEVMPVAILWLLKSYEELKLIPSAQVLELINVKTPDIGPTMDKYYLLARYYFTLEKYDMAKVENYKSYYMTGYRRPFTSLLMGDIYVKLGDRKQALKWYNQAEAQGMNKTLVQSKINLLGL